MTDHSAKIPLLLAAAFALLWFAPTVQANTVADDRTPVPSSSVTEDAVLYAGPVGAMLESDYFRAQHAQSGNGNSLCRLHLYFSSQPFRLARSCE